MPELPEVEAARALAAAHLVGRTIVGVHAEPDESERAWGVGGGGVCVIDRRPPPTRAWRRCSLAALLAARGTREGTRPGRK